NFRHKERAGEQPFFAEWMKQRGYEVRWLPENLYFEGEGDALFGGDVLFCGYKFRSDIQSHRAVADMLGCLVVSVELVDPRFYHLDTCFCPLPDGDAFWFPRAFDEYGQRAIREHVTDLIDVSPEEATHFSCNAVVIERDIVFGKPAFARDANAEPQILQSLRAMSVRVDYTFNTFLFGQRPPTPVQIQPLWRGVELNPCAGPCCRVQDCGNVDLVRFAFQEQTARRMRQHRNEGILDRADHARCHFRFVQIKDGMHGCDDVIKL